MKDATLVGICEMVWRILFPPSNVELCQGSFKAVGKNTALNSQMVKWGDVHSYLHRPISKKIQVHVFSKKVSLWMWCVEFLSSHEEVTRKVIPWGQEREKRMKNK